MAEMQPVKDFGFAERMVKYYVCSTCFSSLNIGEVNGNWAVGCRDPKCTGTGFCTKAYAERKKAESWIERMEAKQNLKDLFPTPKSDKSIDDLINSIC